MKKTALRHSNSEIERLISLDQMRLILAIVEARSFSGAAAALGVSQPSISQQVKRIEQAAGRKLFRRASVGVEPTSDGEAVVVYARSMLVLTDDLRRHFRQNEETVRICVGVSDFFSRTALPTVLCLFMREHPHVEVRVITGSNELLMQALTACSVDLAVMRRCTSLEGATSLWTDALVWKGRADLPTPVSDPVRLVLPMAPNPMRDVVFETLRAHHRTWHVAFESSCLACMEAALQAGLGVSAAPRSMAHLGVETLDERSGLPQLPDAEFMMVEPRPDAGETVRVFAELLRRTAGWGYRQAGVELA